MRGRCMVDRIPSTARRPPLKADELGDQAREVEQLDCAAVQGGSYASAVDAASPVSNIGVSGGCTERAWFGWPCDEETEMLRDAYSREADPAKQKAIVEKLQKRLYGHLVPYVNYGQWFQPAAFRDSLEGVVISPVPFFWNISKK